MSKSETKKMRTNNPPVYYNVMTHLKTAYSVRSTIKRVQERGTTTYERSATPLMRRETLLRYSRISHLEPNNGNGFHLQWSRDKNLTGDHRSSSVSRLFGFLRKEEDELRRSVIAWTVKERELLTVFVSVAQIRGLLHTRVLS